MPVRIKPIYWVVSTIGKQVTAKQILITGNKAIGIDKTPDLGIIVSGIQII